jgi:hypothetical protein
MRFGIAPALAAILALSADLAGAAPRRAAPGTSVAPVYRFGR